MSWLSFLYLYVIIVGCYYFLYGSFLLINNIKSLQYFFIKKQKQLKENRLKNTKVNFILLVPVLKEEKIIAKTLHYLSLLKQEISDIKIIIITTQREFIERRNDQKEKNTIDIVKNLVPLLNRKLKKEVFLHVHYPYAQGSKSDQLNFALKKLQSTDPLIFKTHSTYIGLYDADSTSDLSFLQILAEDASKNCFPLVYQQPVIYLKNYNLLPTNLNGYLMKSFSILQTRYSLGYEVPMFLNSPRNVRRKIGKMAYCLGHGLFVRADFLKKLNFFPSPIEDTRFGHILSYLRCEIRLLPSLAVTDVVEKFSWLLKQTSVWFTGESYFLKDYEIAKSFQRINKIWALSLIFYKFYRNFIWANEGLILGSAFLISWLLPQKIPFFFLLISFLVYVYPCPYYLLISHKKLLFLCNHQIKFHPNKKDYLFSLIFLPIVIFLLFLGPQLGLIRIIKSKITGKSFLLPKTPR